ncbi:hypothetical protein HMPREF9946_02630 [Acetobacteraceae bacterium AT-5844]|nr:hypothetical protein HMPREF9946_02630 [Acetobacteraceae bacterium AT-5844]
MGFPISLAARLEHRSAPQGEPPGILSAKRETARHGTAPLPLSP